MRFTTLTLRRLHKPGRYGDGGGLYLVVISKERRNWIFRYRRQGRERLMGLGSAGVVTLTEAREAAHAARRLLTQGIDPIDARRAARGTAHSRITFTVAAAAYVAAHSAGWRNRKHRAQWRSTLAAYVEPMIGGVPVADINTAAVLRVLQPIWNTKTNTAARIRGRIELVLDYAGAMGWRSGPNPAVWRGGLRSLLPAKSKVSRVKHHAALDWREAPAFIAELQPHISTSIAAAALAFLIFAVARSGEVRGAQWSEMDMAGGTWIIPASRMKGGREHRVPLSPPAMALLEQMAAIRDGSGLVFLSQRRGGLMSDTTLSVVLKRMGRGDLTVHGFRSTFRNWCADTGQPGDAAEAALAHAIGNQVVAAYLRTDLFESRRTLMAAWASFLTRPPAAMAVRIPKGVIVSKHSDEDLRRMGVQVVDSFFTSGKGGFILPGRAS
jgi:integrase